MPPYIQTVQDIHTVLFVCRKAIAVTLVSFLVTVTTFGFKVKGGRGLAATAIAVSQRISQHMQNRVSGKLGRITPGAETSPASAPLADERSPQSTADMGALVPIEE